MEEKQKRIPPEKNKKKGPVPEKKAPAKGKPAGPGPGAGRVRAAKPGPAPSGSGNPVCPVMKKCGACQGFAEGYEKQLEEKRQLVGHYVGGFGKVSPIMGMKEPLYYRNKVHRAFGRDQRGHDTYGTYAEGTHRLVQVKKCLIEDELSQAVIDTVFSLLPSFKLRTYDEDLGYGFLRHVLVRRAFGTGEMMVVLVTASSVFPGKNNFVKALVKAHPQITTVVQNINDKKTSMILGERQQAIYGKGFIRDELCGCSFKISPKSFYQVNHDQTEVLYGKAVELAGLTGRETVIDAYCGIGTIGIVASQKAKRVLGVELNPEAIRDARGNARDNGRTNMEFVCGDAGRYMQEMEARGEKVDVVFMDPPRTGSDKAFLEACLNLAPKRIVYVSCNPETLGRDLKILERGYQVKEICPVDMFPGTRHLETIVLMSRKS